MVFYKEAVEGVKLLWSNKLDEAEAIFAKSKSTNPRHALLYAEVVFFRAIMSESAADRKLAIERLERAISLGEDHVKIYSDNKIPKGVVIGEETAAMLSVDAHIVTADGCTLLATLQIMEDQRIKGLLNLRKGWKTYKEILSYAIGRDGAPASVQVDAEVLSALKFGAGLFYFLISLIPPGIAQKAAVLAGFQGGDKNLGLQYLRECQQSNSIRSALAGLVISLNHLFLSVPFDEDAAPALLREVDQVVKDGVTQFSTGSLFHIFGGIAALEKNNTVDAIRYANAAIDNCKPIVDFPAVFMRLIVNCYLMDFDWGSAIKTIHGIMEQEVKLKSKYAWSATWNSIRIGACYAVSGDSEKSKFYFNNAMNQKGGDAWSQQLRQQASKFIRFYSPFAVFELMVLTTHFDKLINNTTDDRRKEILALFDSMAEKAPGAKQPLTAPAKPSKGLFNSVFSKKEVADPNVDNRAVYLVLRGVVLLSLKRHEECKIGVQEIITNKDCGTDKLYYVMALTLHARSIVKDNREDAITELKLAIKQSDYTWENSLKALIRRLLEKYGVAVVEIADEKEDVSEEALKEELLKEEGEEEKQEESSK